MTAQTFLQVLAGKKVSVDTQACKILCHPACSMNGQLITASCSYDMSPVIDDFAFFAGAQGDWIHRQDLEVRAQRPRLCVLCRPWSSRYAFCHVATPMTLELCLSAEPRWRS